VGQSEQTLDSAVLITRKRTADMELDVGRKKVAFPLRALGRARSNRLRWLRQLWLPGLRAKAKQL